MTSENNSTAAATGDDPGGAAGTARASRRTFLTGAGAAAAGAGALAAGLVGAGPADAATTGRVRDAEPVGESAPIVAYVGDPATGEITLMSGEREVTVVDHGLARAFARKVR